MIRPLCCLVLVGMCLGAVGCGTSTKELPPSSQEVKPDQEKINKAIEDSKSRMPGYRQQPETGS